MTSALSPREREVWALLNTPMTYTEIGARLFISSRTVESHVNSLRRKIGAADRRELARIWDERRGAASLPAELSSFIGRTKELAQAAAMLATARLVNLVGPGGAGKTRLAVAAARRWVDTTGQDCVYVDLVPLRPGAVVAPTVAAACDAGGAGTVETAIVTRLRDRPTLLVLDNVEHVADAAARLIEELLTRCDQLRVLATSRIRLVVPHEQVLLVGGLHGGADGDAVRLFFERHGSGDLDAERVADICAVLGGMPLAIELAVGRLGSFGLDGLETSLGRQLDTLQGGARMDSRHRSLHETIAWSYQLLAPAARDVLAQASVFAEPFTLAAAEEVLVGPVAASVATLCEHSLLRIEDAETPHRYRALEAVREFGGRELSDAQRAVLGLRHARWALRQGSLLERLAAAEWASAQSDQSELAYELWRSLAIAYFREGRLRDAQAAYERVASHTSGLVRAAAATDAAAVARCRVLGEEATRLDLQAVDAFLDAAAAPAAAEALARIADHAVRFQGMFAERLQPTEVEQLLARADGLAGSDPVATAALAMARVQNTARGGGDPVTEARGALALARSAGATLWASGALDALCVALVESGQLADAADLSGERADLILTPDDDPRTALEIKDALHTGALILTGAGRLPEAQRLAERHLGLAWLKTELDLASEEVFAPAALSGNWDIALEWCEGYLSSWRRAGSPVARGRAIGPSAVALIHRLRGDYVEHARWSTVALEMRGGQTDPGGYEGVFQAIGLLHDGDAAGSLASLEPPRRGFFGRVYEEWAAALRFEAAVLLDQDADEPITMANPIAKAIVTRARALRTGDNSAAMATRREFERLGCPYQAQRTRVLAS
ncbi:MAG TPA: LuxR C-terminal-related transcriptional regulator [Solirubrobacteraceae bacterium]|nr:LuxR C-terminal-related transcriptional regulator [Solirubrobacteraceae bacterium]